MSIKQGESAWFSFLSHFQRGVMKPNLYEIRFNLPAGVQKPIVSVEQGVSGSALRTFNSVLNGNGGINVKCHTATFPQRTLQSFEIKQNTTPFRVPYSAIYDPVTFSFYSDSTGDTRRYFDSWQRTVCNVRSNTMNFYNEYTADVDMLIHDDAGNTTYGVRLFEAWPLSVGPLDVSYSQVDNYQTIVTTMAYRRWVELDLNKINK